MFYFISEEDESGDESEEDSGDEETSEEDKTEEGSEEPDDSSEKNLCDLVGCKYCDNHGDDHYFECGWGFNPRQNRELRPMRRKCARGTVCLGSTDKCYQNNPCLIDNREPRDSRDNRDDREPRP